MATSQNCLEKLLKEFKNAIPEEDITSSVEKLQAAAENARFKNASIHDEMVKAQESTAKDYRDETASKEFDFYRDLEIKNNILLHLKNFEDREKGLEEGLKSRIVGTQSNIVGSRDSTGGKISAQELQQNNGFFASLSKENALVEFNSRKNQVDWAKAMNGKKIDNEHIQAGGDIIRAEYEKIDTLYKRQNVFVEDLDNRITRQAHDTSKLMQTDDTFRARLARRLKGLTPTQLFEAAFNRWLRFIHPSEQGSMLDLEKTFFKNRPDLKGDYEGQILFLKNAFNTLTNGGNIYGRVLNRAKQLLAHRVLHFKDEEAFVKYNNKYGTGSVQDSVLQEFRSSIRNIAMFEDWGKDPPGMLQKVATAAQKDDRIKFRFRKGVNFKKMSNLLNGIAGTNQEPSTLFSEVGTNVRAWISITLLQNILIRSIGDLGPVAQELGRIHGGYGQGMIDAVKGLMQGKTSEERKVINAMLGVDRNHTVGGMLRWMGAGQDEGADIGRKMSTLLRLTFKLGGMHWWDYANRARIVGRLAWHLAQNKGKAWDELGADDKTILNTYNLGKQWDLIRKVPTKEADGNEYITPQSVMDITDKDMKEFLQKQGVKNINKTTIFDAKRTLQTNLGNYFEDRMSHGILFPDQADKQFFLRGSPSGSVWNEIAKMAAQFHMYPTAFMTKPLSRLLYGRGAETFWDALVKGKGDLRGLAYLLTSVTGLGYISNAATSIINNETPEAPDTGGAFIRALQAGGGLGLLNDLLFKDPNSFGGGLTNTVFPVVLAQAAKIGDFVGGIPFGSSTLHQFTNLMKNNIPLARTAWTRPAFEYLWGHTVGNTQKPGYWDRRKNELAKRGQHFIINPPGS